MQLLQAVYTAVLLYDASSLTATPDGGNLHKDSSDHAASSPLVVDDSLPQVSQGVNPDDGLYKGPSCRKLSKAASTLVFKSDELSTLALEAHEDVITHKDEMFLRRTALLFVYSRLTSVSGPTHLLMWTVLAALSVALPYHARICQGMGCISPKACLGKTALICKDNVNCIDDDVSVPLGVCQNAIINKIEYGCYCGQNAV